LVVNLRKNIATQDGGYKLLVQKAHALEQWSAKVRSKEVKVAIEEVLNVISGLKGSREGVIRAFNSLSYRTPKGEAPPGATTVSHVDRNTACKGVQTDAQEIETPVN